MAKTRDERRERLKEQNLDSNSSAICHLPSAVLTILAFDFGTNRIGVAVGQTATCTAQALTTLKAKDGIPQPGAVQNLITEWQPSVLVIGLPLNMDGSDSELSLRAKKFGNRLREQFKVTVEFMDERLSSFSAKGELLERGENIDNQNGEVDGIAARLILESWFNKTQ